MITVTYIADGETHQLQAQKGDNLRQLLLSNELSPYGSISKKLNCGGRGICATCGLYIKNTSIKPTHWHDWLAHVFGYPRLSCQITAEGDITAIKPTNKKIWGQWLPRFGREK